MHPLLLKLSKILTIADTPDSTDEERRQHGFLIYMGILMSSGGLLWGSLCMYYGIYIAAAIPYTYILITILNFTYLYYSKNFKFAQILQILISLLLPFFFQFFLGGFVASGGNVLWSVIAVFGSFTLRNKKMSLTWLMLFIALMIFSGLVDSYAKPYDIGLANNYIIFFFVINFILTIAIIFSLYYYFVSTEEKARNELQESLHKLKVTQNQLIESEKMASLGSLVSGVAHEINTPLGVGLTGISQISHEINELASSYEKDTLTETKLKKFIDVTQKLAQTVNDRLNYAAKLVRSFKKVSVDQHVEEEREFDLAQYTDHIIFTLQNQLKGKQVKVDNQIDKEIILMSYPGIFSQILSNLIINSTIHAFEYDEENKITISLQQDESTLTIFYEDNGRGITPEIEKKIFDPFFTTKRGQGGSGLGLHIIYNLITQQLSGSLQTYPVLPHGLGFKITLSNTLLKDFHG